MEDLTNKTYRELQAIAKSLHIPANTKKEVLLAAIQEKLGDKNEVEKGSNRSDSANTIEKEEEIQEIISEKCCDDQILDTQESEIISSTEIHQTIEEDAAPPTKTPICKKKVFNTPEVREYENYSVKWR
jgi:hypothetical protein